MPLIVKTGRIIGPPKIEVDLETINPETREFKGYNKFNYDLLRAGDIEERIKLFYYAKCVEDFEALYAVHADSLSTKTKIFLLNNAILMRRDDIIKKYILESCIDNPSTFPTSDIDLLESLCRHAEYYTEGNSYLVKHDRSIEMREDTDLLEIVEFILRHKPRLITDMCYMRAMEANNKQIVALFNKYHPMKNSEYCYECDLCKIPMRYGLIKGMCACSSRVHYRCVQAYIREFGETCKICSTDYVRNAPITITLTPSNATFHDPNIYFPRLDIFPYWKESQRSGSLVRNKPIEKKAHQLISSIVFLQYDTLLWLYCNSTKEEQKLLTNHLHKVLDMDNTFGTLVNDKIKLLPNTCEFVSTELNKEACAATEAIVNYLFM